MAGSSNPTAPAAPRRRGVSPGWLIGLLAGIGLGISPGPVVLLFGLLAPGCLCHILVPRSRHAVPMLLFGATGILAPGAALLRDGMWLDNALALLQDPSVLARAWLPALLGWGLAQLLPELFLLVLEIQTRTDTGRLRARRAELEAEWKLPGG